MPPEGWVEEFKPAFVPDAVLMPLLLSSVSEPTPGELAPVVAL
jgi:hypothetical protein